MARMFAGILQVYTVSIMLAVPYMNWQYAKDHGFISWLLFGQVVATAKATAWPYFAASSWGGDDYGDMDLHFVNSRRASHEALLLIDRADGLMGLSPSQKQEVVSLLRASVDEARLVSKAYLQKVHPDFPEQFNSGYVYPLRTLLEGFETNSTTKQIMAVSAYNNFSKWASDHGKELNL
jgi:hypothetical protein